MEDSNGVNSIMLSKPAAHIGVVLPDGREDYAFSLDPEWILVHELLHCLIEPYFPDKETEFLKWQMAEQSINTLSYALVALDRGVSTEDVRHSSGTSISERLEDKNVEYAKDAKRRQV
jgi:hypothetical protein